MGSDLLTYCPRSPILLSLLLCCYKGLPFDIREIMMSYSFLFLILLKKIERLDVLHALYIQVKTWISTMSGMSQERLQWW